MVRARVVIEVLALAVSMAYGTANGQTISDRIRAGSRQPGEPLVIGTLGEPLRLSIDQLTHQSDAVVEATVTLSRTYINDADTAVITDFEILTRRVLAGDVPVAIPLILSASGGEVVRDGVTIRAENHGLAPLKPNVVYLLFLKKFGREPAVYQIYNDAVFEPSDVRTRPIARSGADLYPEFVKPYSEVIRRVIDAGRVK